MFEPRVLVHFPTYPDPEKKKQVETGQKLLICNSAPIAHSPFWRPQNPSINPSGPSILRDEHRPSFRPCAAYEFGGSDRVRIICNLHFWMKAYVWVFDHPFSAVSSGGRREENILGNFVIDAVPVGRKVELVYWHESLYWHEPFGGRILKKFTIAPGDNRIDFKIKQPQRSSSNRDTAKLRTP